MVKETTLPAKGGSFELLATQGEYQIMAWVDVQRTGDVLEPGDYINESDLYTLESGTGYNVSGKIKEMDGERFLRAQAGQRILQPQLPVFLPAGGEKALQGAPGPFHPCLQFFR